MSPQSRKTAGILLVVLPTVIYGGVTILSFLINDPAYAANHLRQDLWRAGHAHAGVLIILSLVALIYADEANLSAFWKTTATTCIAASPILLPAGFFFSVLRADATEPNGLISLCYVGAVVLATGLIVLGIGLLRRKA